MTWVYIIAVFLQVKTVISWCVYIFLGLALYRTRGHYNGTYLLGIAFAFLAYAVVPRRRMNAWIAVPVVYFCALVSRDPMLLYAEPGVCFDWLKILLKASVATSVGAALNIARSQLIFVGGTLTLYVFAHILLLQVSPFPKIDVFTTTTSAADFLIQLKNPYMQTYPDLYQGRYGYNVAFGYWPGLLYWVTPFRWLFHDVRWAYLFANLMSSLVLLKLARLHKLGFTTALFFPLLWLSFPVSLFVLEQAWIDSVFYFGCSLAILAGVQKRWWLVGLFLGFAMSVKQYSVFFAFTTAMYVYFSAGHRALAKMVGAAFLAFAVLMLPMVLWNPTAFFENSVLYYTSMPARIDALSVNAWCLNTFGVSLSKWTLIVPLVFAIPSLWQLAKHPGLSKWIRATAVLYAGVFLFAKQAFCNYYYLVAFFVLLECLTGTKVNHPDSEIISDSAS